MGQGGVAETEPMPRLVVGYTEQGGGKLKKGKGFFKPNFEPGPNPKTFHTQPQELGRLPHGDIDFKPRLPNWKLDAIDALPTGPVNKIAVHFKQENVLL